MLGLKTLGNDIIMCDPDSGTRPADKIYGRVVSGYLVIN